MGWTWRNGGTVGCARSDSAASTRTRESSSASNFSCERRWFVSISNLTASRCWAIERSPSQSRIRAGRTMAPRYTNMARDTALRFHIVLLVQTITSPSDYEALNCHGLSHPKKALGRRSVSEETLSAPRDLPLYPAYLKFAVTETLALITTVQVGVVPVHAPAQPVNTAPGSGVAVSVTLVFAAKVTAHPEPVPHETPAGLLVTVPLPARDTV